MTNQTMSNPTIRENDSSYKKEDYLSEHFYFISKLKLSYLEQRSARISHFVRPGVSISKSIEMNESRSPY